MIGAVEARCVGRPSEELDVSEDVTLAGRDDYGLWTSWDPRSSSATSEEVAATIGTMTPNGTWNVYLAGEIHSDWRERIANGVQEAGCRWSSWRR